MRAPACHSSLPVTPIRRHADNADKPVHLYRRSPDHQSTNHFSQLHQSATLLANCSAISFADGYFHFPRDSYINTRRGVGYARTCFIPDRPRIFLSGGPRNPFGPGIQSHDRSAVAVRRISQSWHPMSFMRSRLRALFLRRRLRASSSKLHCTRAAADSIPDCGYRVGDFHS